MRQAIKQGLVGGLRTFFLKHSERVQGKIGTWVLGTFGVGFKIFDAPSFPNAHLLSTSPSVVFIDLFNLQHQTLLRTYPPPAPSPPLELVKP